MFWKLSLLEQCRHTKLHAAGASGISEHQHAVATFAGTKSEQHTTTVSIHARRRFRHTLSQCTRPSCPILSAPQFRASSSDSGCTFGLLETSVSSQIDGASLGPIDSNDSERGMRIETTEATPRQQ
ncbi:hypothetical protein MPTK2_4g08100 [Marchantia polymorpha subsp. ruderalis]